MSLLNRQIDVMPYLKRLWGWLKTPVHWQPSFPAISPLHAFPVLALLLFLRSPNCILHPEFYCEDGTIFFSEAYNYGAKALFMPYASYLHLIPRLIAWATLLDMRHAEFWTSFLAVMIQAGVAAFMLSPRIPLPNLSKAFLSIMIVAYPNMHELPFRIANLQWYTAIWMLMLIVSPPAASKRMQVLESAGFLLASLTGVFAIPLTFLAICRVRASVFHKILFTFLLMASAATIYCMVHTPSRVVEDLNAKGALIVNMFIGQIGTGAIHGTSAVGTYMVFIDWRDTVYLLFVLGVLVYGLVKAPVPIKGLIFLGGCVLAATLRATEWRGLNMSGQGERYFLFLGLAYLSSLLLLAQQKQVRASFLFFVYLGWLFVHGIWDSWQLPAYQDEGWHVAEHLKAIEAGENVVFSIPRRGEPWHVHLDARSQNSR